MQELSSMIMKKLFAVNFVALFFIASALAQEQQEMTNGSIKNFGPVVNSSDDEFFPSVTEDGAVMVFNRRPKGSLKSDIYITYNKNGAWSKPEPVKEINSSDNDETPFISADGKTIIFSSNRKGSLVPPVTPDFTQFYTEDLYVSNLENGKWSEPKPLEGEINTVENERAPSLSPDGKTLYFSRWPYDSIEESRLMMATLEDGKFKNVAEMPYPVNSSYSDFGLMTSRTKPGFYFSSNRRGGYGLWDIYFAHMEQNEIKEIISLGPGINTAENELSLSELGDKIFFCSNRKEGQGGFDIYEILIPRKITDLAKSGFIIRTVDRKTGNPVSVPLEIKYVNPDRPEDVKSERMTTDTSGKLNVVLPDGFRWIILKNTDEKYASITRECRSVAGKMTEVAVALEEIKAPMPVQSSFQNIYFALDSYELRIQYIPVLHEVIDYLRKNRTARIRITGFADRRGEHYHNIDLSLKRSIAVRDYLLSMGIDHSSIEVLGKGYRFPVFTGYGVESDELCRRVEFEVLDK